MSKTPKYQIGTLEEAISRLKRGPARNRVRANDKHLVQEWRMFLDTWVIPDLEALKSALEGDKNARDKLKRFL